MCRDDSTSVLSENVATFKERKTILVGSVVTRFDGSSAVVCAIRDTPRKEAWLFLRPGGWIRESSLRDSDQAR